MPTLIFILGTFVACSSFAQTSEIALQLLRPQQIQLTGPNHQGQMVYVQAPGVIESTDLRTARIVAERPYCVFQYEIRWPDSIRTIAQMELVPSAAVRPATYRLRTQRFRPAADGLGPRTSYRVVEARPDSRADSGGPRAILRALDCIEPSGFTRSSALNAHELQALLEAALPATYLTRDWPSRRTDPHSSPADRRATSPESSAR